MPKVHNPSEQEVIIVEDETLREGFTQIPNAILRRSDVSPGAKLTYMVLLSYAWQRDSCFPGQDRLAEDMGVGRRSIVTYLQQLQQAGLLRIKRRGLGQTNVYTLPRVTDPRSAKFAHQEVQDSTHQEVRNLHLEEDSEEEDSERKIYPSNLRKAKSEKSDYVNPMGSTPNAYPVEHPMARNDEEPPLQESTTKSNEAKASGSGKSKESADFQHTPQSHTVQTTPPPREETHKVQTSGTAPGGFTSIREMIPQQYLPKSIPDDEARNAIRDYIRDIGGKLHDEAPLEHSTTRAFNLYQRSGLDLSSFFNRLYDAEKEANRRSTTIKKHRADGLTNRMPYFFSVLEDKLHLRPKDPENTPQRS